MVQRKKLIGTRKRSTLKYKKCDKWGNKRIKDEDENCNVCGQYYEMLIQR